MQFTVPQFIDVEDKIFGPVTVRQFVIMLVAGMFLFAEYKLSDMALFLVLGIPTFAIFGMIAFLRVNGMPFHYFFINIVETLKRPALRLWARSEFTVHDLEVKIKAVAPVAHKGPLAVKRLSDLSLIVDTGGFYRGIEEENKEISFNK